VKIIAPDGVETWPDLGKDEVASRLAALIAARLG
jgi:phosphopantothenoylcysteine decarboxylase/phosphopantothenate--cysteine ligase